MLFNNICKSVPFPKKLNIENSIGDIIGIRSIPIANIKETRFNTIDIIIKNFLSFSFLKIFANTAAFQMFEYIYIIVKSSVAVEKSIALIISIKLLSCAKIIKFIIIKKIHEHKNPDINEYGIVFGISVICCIFVNVFLLLQIIIIGIINEAIKHKVEIIMINMLNLKKNLIKP